jgi:hypothetical protein
VIIVGVIGMITGASQMYRGVKEMTGSGIDPEVTRLLVESDKTVEDANKLLQEAAPLFQKLMESVDSSGLDTVRKEKQDLASRVSDHFGKAATMLQAAAKEVDDAIQHNAGEKVKPFLTAKATSYRLTADACQRNQEIVALVLDKKVATVADLMPKIEAVAAQRDALEKQAAEASAQADEAAKKAKG